MAKKTINIKQKQYCNKFSKDFKNGLYFKKSLRRKKGWEGVKCRGKSIDFGMREETVGILVLTNSVALDVLPNTYNIW